jgi:hypothetical protein
MMPVAFGWSAGDITKAIELLTTVYRGLKATGGAATEYQESAELLKGLISTLEHLQRLEIECTSPSLVNAVRTLSKTALEPVFQFIEEVAKYEPALKRCSTTSSLKSKWRQAEWAVRVPKKLAKLKADIAMELEPVHLLLGSEALLVLWHNLKITWLSLGRKQSCLTNSQLSCLRSELKVQAREQLTFNSTLQGTLSDLTEAVGRITPVDLHERCSGQLIAQSFALGHCEPSQPTRTTLVLAHSSPIDSQKINKWKQSGDRLCIL